MKHWKSGQVVQREEEGYVRAGSPGDRTGDQGRLGMEARRTEVPHLLRFECSLDFFKTQGQEDDLVGKGTCSRA